MAIPTLCRTASGRPYISIFDIFKWLYYCAFQQQADSKIRSSIDKWVFRCRQSNVRHLLLASGYCRALFRYLNIAQRFDYRRTLDSSRMLGGVAEHLISENTFAG